MNTIYEKAIELMIKGFASKHSTFKDTGCIFIDLGGGWRGYAFPKDKYVEVTIDNVHIGQGNIDLDKMMVMDGNHNRHIKVIK